MRKKNLLQFWKYPYLICIYFFNFRNSLNMLNNLITKPSSRNQYPFFPNLLKLIWIIWNLDLEKSFTGLTIFTIICLQCIQKWRELKMKICHQCLPVLMKTKLKLKLKRLQVRIWKRNGFTSSFLLVCNFPKSRVPIKSW